MQIPVNPNVTIEAAQLLEYLNKTAGYRIVSGQHTQTVECEEIEYIREKTFCEPKIRGFELMSLSPNINYDDSSKECLEEISKNKDSIEVALTWGISANHIVELSYNWFSPIGGHDRSYYSKNTDFDPEKVLQYGTPERRAFFDDMDSIAIALKRFQNVHIPVLWNPLHDGDQKTYWWGRKGPEVAKELYLLMYDYYVNVHHLTNLLWVWSCTEPEGYPGDDYVDIIGINVISEKYTSTDYKDEYEKLSKVADSEKLMVLSNVSSIPDMSKLKDSKIPWAYFIACNGKGIVPEEKLQKVYEDEYVVSI